MGLSEADARIVIDRLLREAGWDPEDKSQVKTERPAARSAAFVAEGKDGREFITGDNASSGRSDYVLYDSRGRPLAVIEAKSADINPYTAKQQAREYAESINAPFIFLSNGELTYFWDYKYADAELVASLYSRRDLERLRHLRSEAKPLATIPIPKFYVRLGEQREVRDYQRNAMRALDHAIEMDKRRFLIELPTGTGKTDIVCLYLKRLFQAERAERILFLVDREELAKQAIAAIQDILNQYSSYWLRAGMVTQEQQITVCLLQTMINRHQEFSSGYFDVVIADECHRSIYGSWQAALTHFNAFHVGLTATPAPYIERNTYLFYGCQEGKPDFTLPIQKAFHDGHLVPYKFAKGITKIIAEGADVDDEHYDPAEFERKWTNEDSNRKMMAEFDAIACRDYLDLAPGQKTCPGKAVVFAISKHHAARLCHYLNALHPEQHGNYAEVITSDVAGVDAVMSRFKLEVYPQVAVSVDMLTTGFDLRELLHLVVCRRIRSPILYQQIRGRGTRTAPHIGKRGFVIYDFFGNHEYFNDTETNVFTGQGGWGGQRERGPWKPPRDLVDLGLQDEWLYAVAYVEVGPEGERVDKHEYLSQWEELVRQVLKDDPVIRKIRSGKPLTSKEEDALVQRLNQPDMFFNEDNLRRAYRSPGGNIIEFVRAALGMTKVKSREEEINENFQAWLVVRAFKPEQAQYLAMLKSRGVARGKLELDDLFKPPLEHVQAAECGVALFGEDGLKAIVVEMNETVFVRQTA
ncbi:DEAD/DEAH box helicase [candidate division WOR-3 bacterium]|uniref:DEAD/DEAH box helicase n=1 Tax=candidate division WOR-3 bacterium TaxID=2052148 RepID=A0A938BUA0_UNCW3|nr:DEAD/DEAH box helicase [candidate division WOR-3 bacterium]